MDHLWLVRHIVGRLFPYLPPETDVENLEAAGTLGLVEATNKFDPERGIQFKTFAYTRIRGAILDELRRNCPLPQHMIEQVTKVRKAYERMPPGATPEAIAAATGMTADEVVDCLAAMRLTRMLSWEEASDPAEPRMGSRQEPPDILVEEMEQKEVLGQGIAALPERERLVVTLYYMEELRLKEIGQVLGLSESRVSRLLSAALFHLGEYMRARSSDRAGPLLAGPAKEA